MCEPCVVHMVGEAIGHRKFKLLHCSVLDCYSSNTNSGGLPLLTNLVAPKNTGDKFIHL